MIVFGSVVKGNWSPGSDIDILVISENIPENNLEQVKIKLELTADFEDHPFEIHLATPKLYNNWYKNFIKENFIEV